MIFRLATAAAALALVLMSAAFGQVTISPAAAPGVNLIQNGDFAVDQRNEGTSLTITTGTANLLPVDRWLCAFTVSTSGAGNPSGQQVALSAGLTAWAKELKITAGTGGSSTPAALTFNCQQAIEGLTVQGLQFGTSAAQPVTVSLWLKSSIASATYGVALQNSANNRAYAHNCSVPSSATWTQCNFTAPGDTTGTWLTTVGGVGLRLIITLDCGSTFQQTADTWAGTNTYCTSSQTQLTNTGSATLEIAGVKVEQGTQPTAFVTEDVSITVGKLRRWYQKSFPFGTKPAQSAGVAGSFCLRTPIATSEPGDYVPFIPPMFSSPTVTTFNPSAANANWRDVTGAADVTVAVDGPSAKSLTGVPIAFGATEATIAHDVCIHWTADTNQ